jgi:hypothetical protein
VFEIVIRGAAMDKLAKSDYCFLLIVGYYAAAMPHPALHCRVMLTLRVKRKKKLI